MKQVRLLRLELTNYRNIDHEVYAFDGNNAKIVGENRIGKTNTLEAIYFLLSNYLLDGTSELSAIKPLANTQKVVCVEGTFEVYDDTTPQIKPREFKLTKTYGEKWVKQRGTDELSMQGHYEEYFVNDIKQAKERDYYNLLEEYFGVRNDDKGDVDTIQMLINPLYLGNLGESKDWTKLRTFIIKLIGDVEDSEIFEKNPQTRVIESDLQNALGRTDLLKKQYKDQIETINTQLLGLDSKIELLEKTDKPSDEEVEKAKQQLEAISGKIYELKTNSGKDSVVEQLEQEVFALSKEIVEKNQVEFNAYLESQKTSEQGEHNKKVKDLQGKVNANVEQLTNKRIKKGQIESEVRTLSERRNTLVHDYKDYEARIKNVDNDVVKECPTCHRPFEESELANRKEELLKNLNTFKEQVVNEGKEVKAKLDNKINELEEVENDIKEIVIDIDNLKSELNELESKDFEKPIFKESDELVALREKEKQLKEDINTRKAKASEKASENYELITRLEEDRMKAQDVLNDRDYYDRQMALLDGLKIEKTSVSKTLIQTEQKREALNTYIYTKLRLLDEHIAKVFGKIKFALVKENINGGFDPICKPYVYDVDKSESTNTLWKSASKSEKIITGIAIVEAIRKELGLSELPYLFDEGGEVSNDTLRTKFKTNAQIICVRVEDLIAKPTIVKF